MFYNTECSVLDKDKSKLIDIWVDIQPYEKTLQYEDDIEVEITARAFCDKFSEITNYGYFQTWYKVYKIMSIKDWSDYMECFLYQCECE